MATIKSYTSLEQSRKLAEILSIESADMYYHYTTSVVKNYHEDIPNVIQLNNHFAFFNDDIPCWSLAALIEVLPLIEGFKPVIDLDINQILYEGKYRDELNVNSENLIDACYAMIIRLHELKVL